VRLPGGTRCGHLLRAVPLHAFTERTGTLAEEVEEGREPLAAALADRGLTVVPDGHLLLVAVHDQSTYDVVRDTVVDLDLPLVRIEPRRHRLEDLFRDEEPAA